MRPLVADELVDLDRYAAIRSDYRRAIIAHKKARRVSVGEKVTLVFEDRETLRFQVQEMLWVERIRDPALVQKELDVYNELMPASGELSATLFVEITELADIRPELDRLIGIDEHVSLVLGDEGDECIQPARFDPKQLEEERISAVQYLKLPLDEEARRRFADPSVLARLRVDHPNYRRECELAPPTRESLQADLAGEPPSLLPPLPEPTAAGDEVVHVQGRLRVLRPAKPLGPGHAIVEAEGARSLLDADPTLLAEAVALVRELAREVTAAHGACRVFADAGPDVVGLRWHVVARPR